MNKIKVLIVDDQSSVRRAIKKGLSLDPDIEVVAEAADAYEAKNKILAYTPDVMTLDVEMPRMNGIEFLKKLIPQYPIRVVIVSTLTTEGASATLEALEYGAFDFVSKPSGSIDSLEEMYKDLIEKVKAASKMNLEEHLKNLNHSNSIIKPIKNNLIQTNSSKYKLIAIGASTGGTVAVKEVITRLPANMPGIIVVIHMPPGFTRSYADRLNELSSLSVKEAQDGEEILAGKVYIAPGDYHLTIYSKTEKLFIHLGKKDKVNGHRPSVDVMFESIVSNQLSNQTIGVIMTGMGDDGARGILKMKSNGATTIGQDKDSCVVYGMPKVAYELGAIQTQLPLIQIANKIKIYAS